MAEIIIGTVLVILAITLTGFIFSRKCGARDRECAGSETTNNADYTPGVCSSNQSNNTVLPPAVDCIVAPSGNHYTMAPPRTDYTVAPHGIEYTVAPPYDNIEKPPPYSIIIAEPTAPPDYEDIQYIQP